MKKLLFFTAIIFLLLSVKIFAQKTVEKKGVMKVSERIRLGATIDEWWLEKMEKIVI